MHTIDLLEEALQLARMYGWQVRYEWLDGAQGGACRLGTNHFLFVDRSLTAAEQLNQVVAALRQATGCAQPPILVTHKRLGDASRHAVSTELIKLLGLPADGSLER